MLIETIRPGFWNRLRMAWRILFWKELYIEKRIVEGAEPDFDEAMRASYEDWRASVN